MKLSVFETIVAALIVGLISSCSSTLVGKNMHEYARYACPIDSKSCALRQTYNEWKINGTYNVEKIDSNKYRISGTLMMDTTESLAAYVYSRVTITFVFTQGDQVVEQVNVIVRGKVNQFEEFSKFMKSEKFFDSSILAKLRFKVSQVPL